MQTSPATGYVVCKQQSYLPLFLWPLQGVLVITTGGQKTSCTHRWRRRFRILNGICCNKAISLSFWFSIQHYVIVKKKSLVWFLSPPEGRKHIFIHCAVHITICNWEKNPALNYYSVSAFLMLFYITRVFPFYCTAWWQYSTTQREVLCFYLASFIWLFKMQNKWWAYKMWYIFI